MKKNLPVLLILLIFALTNCHNNSNNNSGTDSMQPFEGYPVTHNLEEIRLIIKSKCLDTITFKKGEIIADIGAGKGTMVALLSIFHDSLTFYIQDIDTLVCNQTAFNEVIQHYQKVRGKPFTNQFNIVHGTDRETNLPDDTFDKIFILWTYQYFKEPKAIMSDLRLKLKENGLVYMVNPDVDIETSREHLLKHGWNASPIERQISGILECDFELIRFTRNYESSETPYMIVFKKKNLKN
jgi:SAM-dependent methyltransferase